MEEPPILVIDDEWVADSDDARLFLSRLGLLENVSGPSGMRWAHFDFCRGQTERRNVDGTFWLDNHIPTIKTAIEAKRYALVLLDQQFTEGLFDANRRCIANGKSTTFGEFFGELRVRPLLVTMHTQNGGLWQTPCARPPIVMLTNTPSWEFDDPSVPRLSKSDIRRQGKHCIVLKLLQHGALTEEQRIGLLELDQCVMGGHRPVVRSPALIQALTEAYEYAPTSFPVMIVGEPGSGKTTLARLIHRHSLRAESGLLQITPADDVTSCLRGRKVSPTLLVDNLEQFTSEQQFALAGFLLKETSVRPIATCSEDATRLAETGRLRVDLYDYLCRQINVPPLDACSEDREAMIEIFLEDAILEHGKTAVRLAPQSMDVLMNYHFNDNLRGLKRVISQAVAVSGDLSMLSTRDLGFTGVSAKNVPNKKDSSALIGVSGNATLESLPELIANAFIADKDDPALRGIVPRLKKSMVTLQHRIAAAALARTYRQKAKEREGTVVVKDAFKYIGLDVKHANARNVHRSLPLIPGKLGAQSWAKWLISKYYKSGEIDIAPNDGKKTEN